MTDRHKTPRSPDYLAWLRTLPCAWCKTEGHTQASHHSKRGTAIKASDFRALPLCGPHPVVGALVEGCHAHLHRTGRLPGAHMDGEQTTAWAAERALDLHDVWLTRT